MQISIKNCPCYLFNDMINDMINIETFDPSLLEINKLSFKGIFSVSIYYIKYITMKSSDDDNKDFLYLIFNDVDEYIEENNGIKYLVFTSADKNKEALKITQNFVNKTKEQIEAINDDEATKYRKQINITRS